MKSNLNLDTFNFPNNNFYRKVFITIMPVTFHVFSFCLLSMFNNRILYRLSLPKTVVMDIWKIYSNTNVICTQGTLRSFPKEKEINHFKADGTPDSAHVGRPISNHRHIPFPVPHSIHYVRHV